MQPVLRSRTKTPINMEFLDYIRLAHAYGSKAPSDFSRSVNIALMTNFTDEALQKILTGVMLHENIYPTIHRVPYQQYHLHLKNKDSLLHRHAADITFIFFDINPYIQSAFRSDEKHFDETLEEIRRYALSQKGIAVMNTLPLPYRSAYGNLFRDDPLFRFAEYANGRIAALQGELNNFYCCDVNRLLHIFGETQARDLRGLYAFDTPFTNDFLTLVAEEWSSYIRTMLGVARKCLVVDLDNTIWGGVVGEAGPLGILLGPEYPGLAFQNFQQTLLDLHRRGVILAIASRNNRDDVREAFAANPHMALQEKHFASMQVNWNNKAEQLAAIADELHIGPDAMVFLDDDPVNRELVRRALPEVLVPDFSFPPEAYVSFLRSLNVFSQFALTEEDLQKGKMYAEERQRNMVRDQSANIDDYIAELGIVVAVRLNDVSLMPRMAQLSVKTNQFNLTTKRYTEKDIQEIMDSGGLVFSGTVSDKFGDYGTTVLAIALPKENGVWHLDTFLMSCRILGRGIEKQFLNYVIREIAGRGASQISASFIPTQKNTPAKRFLPDAGFLLEGTRAGGAEDFYLDLAEFSLLMPQSATSIRIEEVS